MILPFSDSRTSFGQNDVGKIITKPTGGLATGFCAVAQDFLAAREHVRLLLCREDKEKQLRGIVPKIWESQR